MNCTACGTEVSIKHYGWDGHSNPIYRIERHAAPGTRLDCPATMYTGNARDMRPQGNPAQAGIYAAQREARNA